MLHPLRSFRRAANYNRKLIHLVALITNRLCHELPRLAHCYTSARCRNSKPRFLLCLLVTDKKIAGAIDFFFYRGDENEGKSTERGESTRGNLEPRGSTRTSSSTVMSPLRSFERVETPFLFPFFFLVVFLLRFSVSSPVFV